MKAHTEIILTPEEVDYVYGSVAYFIDNMEKYQQWIRDKQGRPLPGMEEAIRQIQLDIADMLRLNQRIYEECFALKA